MVDCYSGSLEFNPEIEKIARKLRKEVAAVEEEIAIEEQVVVDEQVVGTKETASNPDDTSGESDVEEQMAEEQAIQDVDNVDDPQPLCFVYPALNAPLELKSGLIHLLPIFRGIEREDPHRHLKEFHVVCSSMRPQGVTEEQIKLRAFPFSLADNAKDWLYYLPPGSVTTWGEMVKLFLDQFFPASRASAIRREISGIKQKETETLHDYWERFKRLCASSPRHEISDKQLMLHFYEGLTTMERRMIDAASGGAIRKRTPREARELISTMAANSQQFVPVQDSHRRVFEVSNYSVESKLSHLTTLVENLVAEKVQQAKTCGICANTSHPTDMCPSLQEDDQHMDAVNGFPGPPQRKYDPFSNTYNPGWRNHPNFSYKQ
ncbi:uncharacterized protein LOC110627626 [Manihot esculenta]|uniref:uncharacterized protein LOC110627626 n=1 Tax=Manihot esculenta TaxID=3983 RepID=UPI000B5D0DC6|nr:uncharacterized protein LOC110627626 [Manihot esculenta]